jgi:hypothetical protein
MADEVCVVRVNWEINLELLIGKIYQWYLGGYNL